jgi:hypothetical protein
MMATHYDEVKQLLKLAWDGDDLMDQGTLFQLQDRLGRFALRVAKEEGKVKDLIKTFEFLYKEVVTAK